MRRGVKPAGGVRRPTRRIGFFRKYSARVASHLSHIGFVLYFCTRLSHRRRAPDRRPGGSYRVLFYAIARAMRDRHFPPALIGCNVVNLFALLRNCLLAKYLAGAGSPRAAERPQAVYFVDLSATLGLFCNFRESIEPFSRAR
jgi:hypothetical protein